jgi:hypothetical protein
VVLTVYSVKTQAQQQIPEVKLKFNEEGNQYIKFTGLNQVWVRYADLNPGSTVYGDQQTSIGDIGIRRLRFQTFGQLTERVFFYAQFGQNNFSFLQQRYTGAFFHDAITEFAVHPKYLSLGSGLTAWGGFLRYSAPSVGTIMSLDVPLYQQATNGQSDQFVRKLSAYAKGQLGRVDYQLAISKPLAVQNAGITSIESKSNFNTETPTFQYSGYFKLHLKDIEGNTTPYNSGTYIGRKDILTIGSGFMEQKDATWSTDATLDTIRENMQLLGIDVFYEHPLGSEKSMALTIYGAYSYTNFGHNYLRNVGVMNPANGVKGHADQNYSASCSDFALR